MSGLSANRTRFEYQNNVAVASKLRSFESSFWPPAGAYLLHSIDLVPHAPDVPAEVFDLLVDLKASINAEWEECKRNGCPRAQAFSRASEIARTLRRIAGFLRSETDRTALSLRADAVESGYTDAHLEQLAAMEEDVSIVAGKISTWFGKHVGGMPTAFGCRTDPDRRDMVRTAMAEPEEIGAYLRTLHPALRIGSVPAFSPTFLFYMAGEGNLHPKHIAYFLPEDEGVKRSPFKKTYYFVNTHLALADQIARPLYERHVDIGVDFDPTAERFFAVPTLGVLGHEHGHFVHRPDRDFQALNRADRWASIVLQEVVADVFGILILAEVWAGRFDLRPHDVVAYYLAECVRYVSRGLGHFPDSDGMFLQLNYFRQLGALDLREPGARLVGDPEAVLAALRSMARVLGDALLDGDGERAVEFYRAFGPQRPEALQPLIDELSQTPVQSVEYSQEYLSASRQHSAHVA